MWRQVEELKTASSAGGASGPPHDALAGVRSQLAELQAELPEYRSSREVERLRQIAAAIDQLKQPGTQPENGGVDAKLMDINARIEQLNQDLYRDFP